MILNMDFVRSNFPALNSDWIYFDNAGGSQILKSVVERMNEYYFSTNVQLGASYDISARAGERVMQANKFIAELINAGDESEIVLGSSTTMLIKLLSLSFAKILDEGDEIIVTNSDHEANIGSWVRLEERGVKVRFWKLNQDNYALELGDLEKLMTERTKLVAFTNASNVLGTINPAKEITKFVHERGALVCIDGVAYAPHRVPDVKDIDADFYAFSFYKVYGPHYSVLYSKKKYLLNLPGLNHYFIEESNIPYKLQPGSQNYELSYSLLGLKDYIEKTAVQHGYKGGDAVRLKADFVFDLFKNHEESLSRRLLSYLNSKKGIRIIGESTADSSVRVPTISFVHEKFRSDEITLDTDKFKIGIRYGDFYARRLTDYLGLDNKNGVTRVSMVHYNTPDEVEKLIGAFEKIL